MSVFTGKILVSGVAPAHGVDPWRGSLPVLGVEFPPGLCAVSV